MRVPFKSRLFTAMALVLGIAIIVPLLWNQSTSRDNTLVLYCAHDSIFADSIIRQFESRTGISVHVRYDEETNKSLGLTNLLIAEEAQPRCDVFWNNQTLGTIRLKQEELLASVDPELFARIPNQFKDEDNQWAGFAARLRVFIINTDRMKVSEDAVATALKADSLANAAIAVPLFGTTLSHYAVLCDQTGLEELKSWHASLHQRGIREVRGNGAVKDLVAEGACDFGFTDTDDAFAAIDAGKPVKMLPVRLDSGQTICLPNSVAMIRNCPHPESATKFIAYLLSEEVEIALANSGSRQIPLGQVDNSRLPTEVLELRAWAADGVSLQGAARHHEEVLKWLTAEYTGGGSK
ncbi:MAG TPA: extracellular solute-binding protein [Planctomycetaceae bacterium]|nr:extracellular solute-binding protein [Planctomycetaceae bacterium]